LQRFKSPLPRLAFMSSLTGISSATATRIYKDDAIAFFKEIAEKYSKALILVGTGTWSQYVQDVTKAPLTDKNVMYVLHFYAGTHKDALRQKLTDAIQAGVPIFATECGICDASGTVTLDYTSADAWLTLLNKNHISFPGLEPQQKNRILRPVNPVLRQAQRLAGHIMLQAHHMAKPNIIEKTRIRFTNSRFFINDLSQIRTADTLLKSNADCH
jgi:hypothetical protein